MLNKYEISDNNPNPNPNPNPNQTKSEIIFNQNKISKLFTHEDKFNIHKICGTIALLNFVYLFYDFIYSGLNSRITLREYDFCFMFLTWIHGILSLSSVQFLIPRNRTGILPMIWQEFRAHSIIFAMRSIIIANLLYFTESYYSSYTIIIELFRLGIILLTMYMADYFSYHLRENNKESTTATMPYWTGCDPILQKYIKFFYTNSQHMATIGTMSGSIALIIYMIFPIQIAAFLMTLARKNIISAKTYHLLYGLSLLSGYMTNLCEIYLYICINGFCYTLSEIKTRI